MIVYKTGLKLLLGWVAFLPITAYSLGLGDIDVKSFLNQPLRAEISIISARPGEIDDLLVGLANREAFRRASLSRPSHLSDLKFKVEKSEDGTTAVVSIKTQTAVKEPVLNFLVEADWAKGKVFREFTILLDPPYFAQQVTQPVKTPAPAPATTTQPASSVESVQKTEPATIQRTEAVKQPEPIVNQQPEESQTTGNDGYVNESAIEQEYSFDLSTTESSPVVSDDVASPSANTSDTITVSDGSTLWSIAKSIKTDNVSMSQVMLALQRLNQDAFGQSNINNLKQGAVLRVPTNNDYADLSQRDAYIEVLNQNGLWNDYLASVGHTSAKAGNTQKETSESIDGNNDGSSNDSLSILAVEEGDSDKATLSSDNDANQVSQLRKKLLLSEEKTESLKVEKEELASRVKALEEELAKRNELENLVSIEDNSLATMEQNLADQKVEQLPAEEPMQETPIKEFVMEEQEQAPAEMVEESMTEVSEEPVIETEEIVQQETETPVAEVPEIIVDEPAPIIVSDTSDSSSMVDDIIKAVVSNPIVQGAIAGVLLLILLVVKFLKGRKDKDATDDSDSIENALSEDPIDTQSGIIIPNVDEDETPINVPQMEENQPVDEFASTLSSVPGSVDEEEEDEFSKTAVISAEDMAAMDSDSAEEESVEQDETLDEVDVYLAYSLFENAEDLLKEKLIDSPERADYRAKLLDTYFATQNKDAFVEEASSLKDLGDSANKYWLRVQAMGYELDPSNPMFADGEGGDVADLAIAKPEVADFDIGAESEADDSEFDLSLDGDETDFNLNEEDNSNELEFNLDESSENELPDDLDGLDFDLNDAEDDAVNLNDDETLESIEADGFEFDLGEETSEIEAVKDIAIEETSIIESEDLDFNMDDDVEISLDDVETDIESEAINIDINENIESSEMTDTMVIAPNGQNELESSEDDLDIELDDGDELNIEFNNTDEEIDIDLDSEEEKIVEVDEPDLDLSSDDSLDFDETSEMPVLEVEENDIDVSETVVIDDVGDLDIPDAEIDDDLDLDLDDEDITDIGNIEGLMLPDDVDEVATKLDLAKAFQDMGDSEGARTSLEEVIKDGNEDQIAEAEALLKQING